MKKLYYFTFIIVAMVLYTSCTNELPIESPLSTDTTHANQTVSEQTSPQMMVIGNNESGTRSSFTGTFPNNQAGSVTFRWTEGDVLWVSTNTAMPKSAVATNLAPDGSTATFRFTGVPNLRDYPIYYVGSNYNASDKECYHTVKIATAQEQELPNDSRHITFDGDCGITNLTGACVTNPAAPVTFSLTHKSTYLCFLPTNLLPGETNGETKLYKVTVETTDGSTIAGTYILGTDGTLTGGNDNKITLYLGKATVYNTGFPIFNTLNQAANAGYMVIAPGTHAIRITYFLMLSNGTTDQVEQTFNSINFKPNTVYSVLRDLTNHYLSYGYHLWDAYLNIWDYGNVTFPGSTTFNSAGSEYWYNEAISGEASNLDNIDPTADQVYRYMNDVVYWDTTTPWRVRYQSGKGGVWLHKKQYIPNFDIPTGIDFSEQNNYSGTNINDIKVGKPDVSVINEYFFLPAAGYYTVGSTRTSIPINFGSNQATIYGGYYHVKTAQVLINNKKYMIYLRFLNENGKYSIKMITHTDTRELMAMLNWKVQ